MWGYQDSAGGRKAPCYKCDKRHIGCHGDCSKYKAFKKEREAIRENRRSDNPIAMYLFLNKVRNCNIGGLYK